MPFEVVLDATLTRVTLVPGKGALGTWRSPCGQRRQSEEPRFSGRGERPTERGWGVCERALKPHLSRKGLSGKSQGENRNREIRPSGIAGGPEET